jgi:hypothetical protein
VLISAWLLNWGRAVPETIRIAYLSAVKDCWEIRKLVEKHTHQAARFLSCNTAVLLNVLSRGVPNEESQHTCGSAWMFSIMSDHIRLNLSGILQFLGGSELAQSALSHSKPNHDRKSNCCTVLKSPMLPSRDFDCLQVCLPEHDIGNIYLKTPQNLGTVVRATPFKIHPTGDPPSNRQKVFRFFDPFFQYGTEILIHSVVLFFEIDESNRPSECRRKKTPVSEAGCPCLTRSSALCVTSGTAQASWLRNEDRHRACRR